MRRERLLFLLLLAACPRQNGACRPEPVPTDCKDDDTACVDQPVEQGPPPITAPAPK